MDKYIGRFRVLCPIDSNGEFTDNLDDTYVRCKNNMQMFRYSEDTLGLYIPNSKMANKLYVTLWDCLTEETQKQINYEIQSLNGRLAGEWTFYFYEKYIDNVAEVVVPKTLGANIKPFSKRNLPKIKGKVEYVPVNEVLLNEFKEKLKEIVVLNQSNVSLYTKAYKYIENRLEKNITSFSKDNGIKFVEGLDKLELIEEAIGLLDSFAESIG